MLGGSAIYWYQGDRLLVPEEHAFHLGWGDDINVSQLDLPLESPEVPQNDDDCSAPAKKKRRLRRGVGPMPYGPKLVELAGNGMSIPDASLILYSTIMASTIAGLFTSLPPDLSAELTAMATVAGHGPARLDVLDCECDFNFHHKRLEKAEGLDES